MPLAVRHPASARALHADVTSRVRVTVTPRDYSAPSGGLLRNRVSSHSCSWGGGMVSVRKSICTILGYTVCQHKPLAVHSHHAGCTTTTSSQHRRLASLRAAAHAPRSYTLLALLAPPSGYSHPRVPLLAVGLSCLRPFLGHPAVATGATRRVAGSLSSLLLRSSNTMFCEHAFALPTR